VEKIAISVRLRPQTLAAARERAAADGLSLTAYIDALIQKDKDRSEWDLRHENLLKEVDDLRQDVASLCLESWKINSEIRAHDDERRRVRSMVREFSLAHAAAQASLRMHVESTQSLQRAYEDIGREIDAWCAEAEPPPLQSPDSEVLALAGQPLALSSEGNNSEPEQRAEAAARAGSEAGNEPLSPGDPEGDPFSHISLPELIGRKVRLVRDGRQWKGCCPFHSEETPSFYVYDYHFHCFGCGARGDAISFLMRAEGVPFPEAVDRLAAEAKREPHTLPRKSATRVA
jgi:hypothetical protein